MSSTPSYYITKATHLLELAEDEADTQKAQMLLSLANCWLQIEQLERYTA